MTETWHVTKDQTLTHWTALSRQTDRKLPAAICSLSENGSEARRMAELLVDLGGQVEREVATLLVLEREHHDDGLLTRHRQLHVITQRRRLRKPVFLANDRMSICDCHDICQKQNDARQMFAPKKKLHVHVAQGVDGLDRLFHRKHNRRHVRVLSLLQTFWSSTICKHCFNVLKCALLWKCQKRNSCCWQRWYGLLLGLFKVHELLLLLLCLLLRLLLVLVWIQFETFYVNSANKNRPENICCVEK